MAKKKKKESVEKKETPKVEKKSTKKLYSVKMISNVSSWGENYKKWETYKIIKSKLVELEKFVKMV